MGSFGRNRTISSKKRYRVTNKRRGKSTLNKVRSRGYGFAYGYVRIKPKKKSNTYAKISNEYFRYGKYK